MLTRRFLYKKQLWHAVCSCVPTRHAQSASQSSLDILNFEKRLPASIKRQSQRQPFVKNLFLGVFDHEFMYYPEPQTKERHQQFFEWLEPIEKYMSESLEDPKNIRKDDILSNLRDLGVFRAHVSEHHLGLDLNQSELAKLVEVLSCFPWLGSYMIKNHIAPLHIISTLASEEQKAKYLPKIVTGELIPTICFTENGLNTDDIDTNAILSDCNTHWILNGEKSFVVNGHDSNLFLVFAECNSAQNSIHDHKFKKEYSTLSVFLIERNFNGITCKDTKNLAGLQDNPICNVVFNNTKVPRENLLGEIQSGMNILVDSLAPGNRNIAPQAVGILRVFMKLLTRHILQRKHLNQNLHEYENVQKVIGKIASTLYSMESMLYFTTGMIDTFENQDCVIEKAMLEMYCANECVTCIYQGLQIIGSPSYLRDNPYIQILEDALSYTLFDSYNPDSDTYIALLGLQYTGKNLRDHIYKIRNPFNFPQYILKCIIGKKHQLNLRIAEHLHPSLANGSSVLEECIGRLQAATLQVLQRHGVLVHHQHMELCRISELAMRTFALTTVLSRASRAYCIGLRNAEQDRHVASSIANLTIERIRVLSDEITAGEWENGDKCHKTVAEVIYNKKDYFAEHPLNRTY